MKMKRGFKEWLSVVLSLCMVLSSVVLPGGTAQAEGEAVTYAETQPLKIAEHTPVTYTIAAKSVSGNDSYPYQYEAFNYIILPGDKVVFDTSTEIVTRTETVGKTTTRTRTIDTKLAGAVLAGVFINGVEQDSKTVTSGDLLDMTEKRIDYGPSGENCPSPAPKAINIFTEFTNTSDYAVVLEYDDHHSALKQTDWKEDGDSKVYCLEQNYNYVRYRVRMYDVSVPLTYNLNGGSMQGEKPYDSYYLRNPEEAYEFEIPGPVKEGYHFKGWNVNKLGVATGDTTNSVNIEMYEGDYTRHIHKNYVDVVNGQTFVKGQLFYKNLANSFIYMGFYGREVKPVLGKSEDIWYFQRGGTHGYAGNTLNAVYVADCTVTLVANGGKLADGLDKRVIEVIREGNANTDENIAKGLRYTVTGCDLSVSANKVLERENYTFDGWYSDVALTHPFYGFDDFRSYDTNGDGKVDANDNAPFYDNSEKICRIYAKWTPDKYRITYELGGENVSNGSNPAEYSYGQAITLSAPGRAGYAFAGWYSDAEFNTVATGIAAGAKGDQKFYAKWTPTYTVKFDGNGADKVAMADMTCEVGKKYNLTENTYKKAAYAFAGWNTKADGSGTAYADKAAVQNLSGEAGGVVTLYAQWERTGYLIIYGLNGGTNNPDNPDVYDETMEVKVKEPTRKGYKFAGWYSNAALTKEASDIAPGSSGTKFYYAKWKSNKYSVKFDGNGGIVSGKNKAMADMKDRSYGTSFALSANKFTRKDYVFTGWNTEKNGTGARYQDKETVLNLADTDGAEVTLYAQWELKATTCTITYKLNGGTNNSANPYFYTKGSEQAIALQEPTREGYDFVGWYKNSGFTGGKQDAIAKGSSGNKTFYAKWKPHTYTIVFDANEIVSGGDSDVSAGDRPVTGKMYSNNKKSCNYGKKYTLANCGSSGKGFSRKGYTFLGWNTASNGSGAYYKNKASVKDLTPEKDGTVTLYAQWQVTEYTITYKKESGGVVSGSDANTNPKSYTINTDTFPLLNLERDGYTFGGWYKNSRYTGKKQETIAQGSTGKMTLYAKWTANKYTIQFDGNGGTASGKETVEQKNCTYGKSFKLAKNKFKRTGYTFTGWNTRPDGTGTNYKNQKSVKNLTGEANGKVTLYAQWKEKK